MRDSNSLWTTLGGTEKIGKIRKKEWFDKAKKITLYVFRYL
jgi:hypothetical protein